MSRKKLRTRIGGNHERWLVSYADFITLLFAFFVVLYAASQLDRHKASALSGAIEQAFQSMGGFPNPARRNGLSTSTTQAVLRPKLVGASLALVSESRDEGIETAIASQTIEGLRKRLEEVLEPQIRRRELAIANRRDGLVISLREVGFFDSGRATLRVDAEPAFARLAAVLQQSEFSLRIEGHTDNVPIHNQRFSSNWELSTARATETIRLLVTGFHFDPQRISAAGYAEFHPLTSNDTPTGRALNRRVDIVVLGSSSRDEAMNPLAATAP